ncbi:universal stress protein [uncultured Roseibium sp.]|uniref:universal stress protein n=1 Tax=uncultured Roseibium sp. TaxID=1936171 RepID=UPI002616B0B2|nr:universal stress protein [uncultured Roseibium sp.]
MSKRIVVGYDGSENAMNAVEFAVGLAKAGGAGLVLAHVLEWSPYTFLTPTEIEERHARRNEELERAQTAVLEPVLTKLAGTGLEVASELRYGHIAETLIKIAEEEGVDHLVIGRTGHSKLSSRIFGSVAGSLAQAAPVPVTIVP